MTAYLITLSPKRKTPSEVGQSKSLRRWRTDCNQLESPASRGVSIARRTSRSANVFLLRQGKQGHAILGYGHVAALPKDKTSRMTVVEFEGLVDPMLSAVYATADELETITDHGKLWRTQSSGIGLPTHVANQLEALVVGRAEKQARRLPVAELEKVTPEHIWNAVQKLTAGYADHDFAPSTDYDLIADDDSRLAPEGCIWSCCDRSIGSEGSAK